jgi:hypothetical protein
LAWAKTKNKLPKIEIPWLIWSETLSSTRIPNTTSKRPIKAIAIIQVRPCFLYPGRKARGVVNNIVMRTVICTQDEWVYCETKGKKRGMKATMTQ